MTSPTRFAQPGHARPNKVVERDRLKAGIAELVAELDDLPELVEAHLVHGDVSKNAFSAEFNKAVALISRHKPNGGAA